LLEKTFKKYGTTPYKITKNIMEHHLINYWKNNGPSFCELSRQMKNSIYKGKYPKLERMDNPLQWQGRMEVNTDRDGEGGDEMNLL
jgi:hypothetical protein